MVVVLVVDAVVVVVNLRIQFFFEKYVQCSAQDVFRRRGRRDAENLLNQLDTDRSGGVGCANRDGLIGLKRSSLRERESDQAKKKQLTGARFRLKLEKDGK